VTKYSHLVSSNTPAKLIKSRRCYAVNLAFATLAGSVQIADAIHYLVQPVGCHHCLRPVAVVCKYTSVAASVQFCEILLGVSEITGRFSEVSIDFDTAVIRAIRLKLQEQRYHSVPLNRQSVSILFYGCPAGILIEISQYTAMDSCL